MKRFAFITTAFFLTVSFPVFATKKPASSVIQKDGYQLSFDKILVEDDIDIRLSESSDRHIEISGNEEYVKYVDWRISNGILFLSSRGGSLKNKVQVSINVSQLKILTVTGDSNVKSEGALNSNELKVFAGGESSIAIQNTGSINLEASSHIDFNVKRKAGNVKIN